MKENTNLAITRTMATVVLVFVVFGLSEKKNKQAQDNRVMLLCFDTAESVG